MDMLLDMGFSRAQCERAMRESNNDTQHAANYIMMHMDKPPEFWLEAPAAATPPPPAHAPPAEGLGPLAAVCAAVRESEDYAMAGTPAGAPEPAPADAAAGAAAADGSAPGGAASAGKGDVIDMTGDGTAVGADGKTRPSNEDIMNHWQSVVGGEAEGIKEKPLVGELEKLNAVRDEYDSESGAEMRRKIESLASRYTGVRRARNDGNCFYRGFAFSLLEYMLCKATDVERESVLRSVEDVAETLKRAGFQELVFEDFQRVFLQQLRDCCSASKGEAAGAAGSITVDVLVERMKSSEISDYVIMFLRFVTSAELHNRQDFFAPFMDEDGMDMEKYRQSRVDPMGEEADQLHIIALVDALRVPVRVEYLQAGGGDEVNHHDFQPASESAEAKEAKEPFVVLLYRPGHYDVLYASEREISRKRMAEAALRRQSSGGTSM